jgi:hypothetical protein
MLHYSALPASVSSCLHPLDISDLLLCLCITTTSFSSSHRYTSLFFSSSMLHLLHIMLLHAWITPQQPPILYALRHIYTLLVLYSDDFSLHAQKDPLENSISSLLCMTHHANTCLDHHNNSSSSLAVPLMYSSSMCAILRFLSLSRS